MWGFHYQCLEAKFSGNRSLCWYSCITITIISLKQTVVCKLTEKKINVSYKNKSHQTNKRENVFSLVEKAK